MLQIYLLFMKKQSFFFFFRQKTAYEMRISDWSSDVCSSDLLAQMRRTRPLGTTAECGAFGGGDGARHGKAHAAADAEDADTGCGHDWISEIGRAPCRERECQYV